MGVVWEPYVRSPQRKALIEALLKTQRRVLFPVVTCFVLSHVVAAKFNFKIARAVARTTIFLAPCSNFACT